MNTTLPETTPDIHFMRITTTTLNIELVLQLA